MELHTDNVTEVRIVKRLVMITVMIFIIITILKDHNDLEHIVKIGTVVIM